MLLSFENIAHYLLEKGLIDIGSVIRGDFSVRNLSSRNANFAVNCEYAPAYLVKQVRAQDLEKLESLRIEATCYWLAGNDPAYRALAGFLPGYHDYDYLQHILVLEWLPSVRNMHEFYRGGSLFPVAVAEELAVLLSTYHTHETGVVEQQKSYSLFKKRKPWVLSISEERLTDWLKNPATGPAEKQPVKLMLENKEFMSCLSSIEDEWETKSLIHGDVKFPNLLINTDYTPGARPDIRLIDWELADIGDPLWDVAAAIQNYLTLWIASEIDPEQDHSGPVTLEMVRPSIAAFWQRYADIAGWDKTETRRNRMKMLRYVALKLVHTCFESVQHVKDMSLFSAKLLQLSLNLLKKPEVAAAELLGIADTSENPVDYHVYR